MRPRELLTAARVTLVLVLLSGVGYPAVLYGLAHAAFPWQAETSLLRNACGDVVGSALIGQQFTSAHWFHGRPSAVAYNGAGSGGSNLGPTNAALADSFRARAAQFRTINRLDAGTALPADVVTASGSGLDPDVSLEAALLQVGRVSAARQDLSAARMDSAALAAFVRGRAVRAWIGLDARRVNVLRLNLALDSVSGATPPCPPRSR